MAQRGVNFTGNEAHR